MEERMNNSISQQDEWLG
jgi:predicted  nucleic acid-binding Zn-ribbon protein